MAENTSGNSATSIVAIVAILILAMMAFFVFRGVRRGGSDSPSFKGNIELKAPTPQGSSTGSGTPK